MLPRGRPAESAEDAEKCKKMFENAFTLFLFPLFALCVSAV
jgi:hypothetical protein